MKTINFGHIKLEIDIESTEKFYANQEGFVCDCTDCIHYVNSIPILQKSLKGLDKEIGLDLTKAVGQGMDELMPHDYNDIHLDVIPYYAVGKCYVGDKELDHEKSGTTLTNPNQAHIKLTEDLSLSIINSTGDIEIGDAKNVLTIWIEFRTKPK